MHGEKGGKQYICKTCNKSLQTQARLIHHEKCHYGERPEKEFACEECKYTTITKAYLKDHIRRMHVVRGVGWMCVEGACEKKPKTFVNKGTFQKRFSGFCPLRGGVPPFSAKEKNLLFFTLIFR